MQLAEKWFAHPVLVKAHTVWRSHQRWFNYERAWTHALDPKRGAPDGALVEQLMRGWGDASLVPNDPFLWSCIQEVSRTRGPIIQLGSGLTTLVLAIFAQRCGRHLWVLEHNRHWANTVSSHLEEHGISLAHVITAPLTNVGRGVWYNVDVRQLPKSCSLVVCDGDSVAPTGYPHVLDRLVEHLSPEAVVIVRNVRRSGDAKYLTAWAKAHGAATFVRKADEPYVKVVMRGHVERVPQYSVRHTLSASQTTSVQPAKPQTEARDRDGSTNGEDVLI
jgi:predicted O-methyltransferase YrrM